MRFPSRMQSCRKKLYGSEEFFPNLEVKILNLVTICFDQYQQIYRYIDFLFFFLQQMCYTRT